MFDESFLKSLRFEKYDGLQLLRAILIVKIHCLHSILAVTPFFYFFLYNLKYLVYRAGTLDDSASGEPANSLVVVEVVSVSLLGSFLVVDR